MKIKEKVKWLLPVENKCENDFFSNKKLVRMEKSIKILKEHNFYI
jgi:hypothetical protein